MIITSLLLRRSVLFKDTGTTLCHATRRCTVCHAAPRCAAPDLNAHTCVHSEKFTEYIIYRYLSSPTEQEPPTPTPEIW